MIRKVDHVGVAVHRIAERLTFWRDVLDLEVGGTDEVPSEGVRVAFLPVGESRIELIEATRDDSPIAKFLVRRGEGLHQLALAVTDAGAVLSRVRERSLPMLDEVPRAGAQGTRVAFLHPKATGGVLVELVERADHSARDRGFEPGTPIILTLRDPQERLWGLLREMTPAGIAVHGLDLTSFDDWAAQVERGGEEAVGPSLLFFPMARVERILADRRSGDLPSLAERFERRTGRSVASLLDD